MHDLWRPAARERQMRQPRMPLGGEAIRAVLVQHMQFLRRLLEQESISLPVLQRLQVRPGPRHRLLPLHAVQCVRINQGRSPLHPPKIAGELSHLSRDNVREHGAPAWVEMRSCHAFELFYAVLEGTDVHVSPLQEECRRHERVLRPPRFRRADATHAPGLRTHHEQYLLPGLYQDGQR